MSKDALPPPARARSAEASFSSCLSSADYGATLAAGLEPLGVVQGTCVLAWTWYGPRTPYGGPLPLRGGTARLKRRYYEPRVGTSGGRNASQSIVFASSNWTPWACQHTVQLGGDHEPGVNFEQNWVEDRWSEGFSTARTRMLAEASVLGAHGVVGVLEEITTPFRGAREFLLRGTAVRVRGGPRPHEIWSTYLAGERLIKLVEAGWAPVAVLGALASMRIWPACSTESQLSGRWNEVSTISQIQSAHYAVRALARTRVHAEAGPDDVHGVRYEVAEHHVARGDEELTCTVWGSRIRRFAPAEQLGTAQATVSLR